MLRKINKKRFVLGNDHAFFTDSNVCARIRTYRIYLSVLAFVNNFTKIERVRIVSYYTVLREI